MTRCVWPKQAHNVILIYEIKIIYALAVSNIFSQLILNKDIIREVVKLSYNIKMRMAK